MCYPLDRDLSSIPFKQPNQTCSLILYEKNKNKTNVFIFLSRHLISTYLSWFFVTFINCWRCWSKCLQIGRKSVPGGQRMLCYHVYQEVCDLNAAGLVFGSCPFIIEPLILGPLMGPEVPSPRKTVIHFQLLR